MDTVAILLQKITNLAMDRQEPLRIFVNPKYEAYQAATFDDKSKPNQSKPDPFLAAVGNASVGFYSYSFDDMVEVYAGLKSQLEQEQARINLRDEMNEQYDISLRNRSGAV